MRLTWKVMGVGITSGLLMMACGGGGSSTPTPTPTSSINASSKAADLRATLDLLLGEHVVLTSKATSAVLGRRDQEYAAYGKELAKNSQEFSDKIGAAFGDSTKQQFNKLLGTHDSLLVGYSKAVAANDKGGIDRATKALTPQYVSQLSEAIAGTTGISQATSNDLISKYILETKKLIDDQAVKNWVAAYSDLRMSSTQMQIVGDHLAEAIVSRQHNSFPGNVSSKAAGFRVTLDMLLQEHLFLSTSNSDAVLAGRMDEAQGASSAINANGVDLVQTIGNLYGLSTQTKFDKVWRTQDSFWASYVTGVAKKDQGMQKKAVTDLTTQYVPQCSEFWAQSTGLNKDTLKGLMTRQVFSAKVVVDAQIAAITTSNDSNWHTATESETSAAHQMQLLGDPLAEAIITKLPGKL